MNEHFTSFQTTERPGRDWAAIRGEMSIYLLAAIGIAAGLAWHKDYEVKTKQIEIAEKQQHILELYSGVLQKDLDDIRKEVR
jgi:hypothetical protein